MGLKTGYSQELDQQKSLVIKLLEDKKPQVAIDTLNSMRLQSLEDPELYYLLGKAYSNIADHKNAEVAYKMALYFKKSYLDANYELGLVKLKLGLPGEAIFFLNQVATDKPDHNKARRRLGEAYYLVKKYQPALEAFNHLIKADDTDYESYYFVGLVRLRQGLLDGAVWNLQQCLKITPDYMPALKILSQIYVDSQRGFDALPLFKCIMETSPDSLNNKPFVSELFLERGKILYQQDSLQKAMQDFRSVLVLEPVHQEAMAIMGKVYKKQNYDSLMIQAGKALENQNIQDAQNLFSKAILQAKTVSEQDSISNFLDSLNTILNFQKIESKITLLFEQAEKAFSQGKYELALQLYQEILLLSPSDEASQNALKTTGSLKYFLEATEEWNDENWRMAKKKFEQVISYYPNFPGIKAKYQALKKIERLETQRAIVGRALKNQHYQTAKSLFQKLFKFDSNNPKLYETWFQIQKSIADFYVQTFLKFLPYIIAGIIAFILLLALIIPRKYTLFQDRLKLIFALLLFIFPTLFLVASGGLLLKSQIPSDVQLTLSSKYVSFLLNSAEKLNASIDADSVVMDHINQLELSNVEFTDKKGVFQSNATKKLSILSDSLRAPIEIQFTKLDKPIEFKECSFDNRSKLILRVKESVVFMTFYPPTLNENNLSWFTGRINTPDEFQVKIPVDEKVFDDSNIKIPGLNTGELSVSSLDSTSTALFKTSDSKFKMALKGSRLFKFRKFHVNDLSVQRFLPGDGEINTINGMQQGKIKLSSKYMPEKTVDIKGNFYIYPNSLELQAIEVDQGILKLSLVGRLKSFIISNQDNQVEELIPNYLMLVLRKWIWAIPLALTVWLGITIFSLILIIKFHRRKVKAVTRKVEVVEKIQPSEKSIDISFEELVQPFHTKWQQRLNQTIIPQLEGRKNRLELDIESEKNKRKKKQLVKILNNTKIQLEEHVNELNK